ncbi:hypothetical protein HYW36_00240 [Candidatus Saccharibacteria bacterium]|nr:hypothetical protein [Candidatus Saccharibacteria bacterium]
MPAAIIDGIDFIYGVPKEKMRGRNLAIAAIIIAAGLLIIGIGIKRTSSNSTDTSQQASQSNKTYYISFDDYYFEVPKQKTVDDKIVPGVQFLYSLNAGIKTNTLDDLFNDGAVGVQALIPLNGENQAFERYLNNISKPAAASAFQGTADIFFSDRKDGVRAAELLSKKNGQILRRQYIVNLPQSVAVVSKEDNETFKSIGRSISQASAKFSDYENIKVKVLAEGVMLKNRMFEDIYFLAHEGLKDSNDLDDFNRLAERSKDILELEIKVFGVKISKKEMTAAILFSDSQNPAKNQFGSMVFRQSEGKWKLYTLQLPNGTITGATEEDQ